MTNILDVHIQLRKDSEYNWKINNPILKDGEAAIVEFDENYINMKIGNGISSFNDLPYLYQNQITSENILCKNIKVKSIAQGYSVKATPTSLATGVLTEADGNFNVVHGIEAHALSSDDYAFVYNGINLPNITDRYQSHGEGTFNINPMNGISGLYVGERNLDSILCAFVAEKTDNYYTKSESDLKFISAIPIATSDNIGTVKVNGNGLSVGTDGTIGCTINYLSGKTYDFTTSSGQLSALIDLVTLFGGTVLR